MINRLISIAPMMECTDRHDRYFLRLIAPHVLLYTEMITAQALLHGDYRKLLAFHPLEHPLALQVGGSDPAQLAKCARLGESFGYDEINLNVGCPSDRVNAGHFGACLMLEPQQVAECIAAMISAVTLPVTVKCRIGVDQEDSYESLTHFINLLSTAGCKVFIIHARKAWLSGLSPKENREIPPLCYDIVKQIKLDFPHLTIIVNGGIKTLSDIEQHIQWAEGVMIGREAYTHPYFLAEIEQHFFATEMQPREKILEKLLPYLEQQLKNKTKLSSMTRHILGLFHGQKGARIWRRYLSENAHKYNAGITVVNEALHYARSIDEAI